MRFWKIFGTVLGVLVLLAVITLLIVTPILSARHGTATWFEEWQYWFDGLKEAGQTAEAFINLK